MVQNLLINQFCNYLLKKENNLWTKEIKQIKQVNIKEDILPKIYTTSLKFYSKEKIIQTLRVTKSNEIENYILMHNLEDNGTTKELSQFKENSKKESSYLKTDSIYFKTSKTEKY